MVHQSASGAWCSVALWLPSGQLNVAGGAARSTAPADGRRLRGWAARKLSDSCHPQHAAAMGASSQHSRVSRSVMAGALRTGNPEGNAPVEVEHVGSAR